jgi:glycerol-3-phosphate dehydrogenase
MGRPAYRVALVEKADFASGTSSKSTKLIHGGIRYLPNFDFALVHEALIERGLLLRNAAFLVHPLAFVLPISIAVSIIPLDCLSHCLGESD